MRKNITLQNKLTILDQQSLALYLQELRNDPETTPLSKEEEYVLFSEYKMNPTTKLKNRIAKSQFRWVVSIAKQYEFKKGALQDFINEGNIGVLNAVDKFEVESGNRFATFATWYIRQAITNYVNDVLADVPQPANRFVVAKLLKKAEMKLKMVGIVEPSDEELLDEYNKIKKKNELVLDLYLLNEIRNNSKTFISMHTSLSINEDMSLEGTFKSGPEFNTDFEIVQTEQQDEIKSALNNILNEREVEIVEYMVGLNGKECKTLEQISDILGLTRERTGQIYAKALKTLSNHKKLMFEILGSSKHITQNVNYNDSVSHLRTYSL